MHVTPPTYPKKILLFCVSQNHVAYRPFTLVTGEIYFRGASSSALALDFVACIFFLNSEHGSHVTSADTLQVQPSPQVHSLHMHFGLGHAKPSSFLRWAAASSAAGISAGDSI